MSANLRESVNRSLYSVGQSPIGEMFAGVLYKYAAPIMPGENIIVTPKTVVYKYPLPSSWEHHLLAVPRNNAPGFASVDFDNPEHTAHLRDLLIAVQAAARSKKLPNSNYTLLMNGGKNQDIPQLHVHLLAGSSSRRGKSMDQFYETRHEGQTISSVDVGAEPILGSIQNIDLHDDGIFSTVTSIFHRAQNIIRDPNAGIDRYSIMTFNRPAEPLSNFGIHLVTGKPTMQI